MNLGEMKDQVRKSIVDRRYREVHENSAGLDKNRSSGRFVL
jgi:hypothetical protein